MISKLVNFVNHWNSEGFHLPEEATYQINSPKRKPGHVSISKLYKPVCLLLLDKQGLYGETRTTGLVNYHLWLGNLVEAFLMEQMELYKVPLDNVQQPCTFEGVSGICDFTVGQTVVDIKSMSPYYWKEFVEAPNDDRGYITQILCYQEALGMKSSAILALNKVNGELALVPIGRDTQVYVNYVEYFPEDILERTRKVIDIYQNSESLEDVFVYLPPSTRHRLDIKRKMLLPGMKYDPRAKWFFELKGQYLDEVARTYKEETVRKIIYDEYSKVQKRLKVGATDRCMRREGDDE